MTEDLQSFLTQVNFARYYGQPEGHYESFFQRANHPTRPLAFWIRYTIFSPTGQPEQAVGGLWAVYFNGETSQHVAVKQVFPINECEFNPTAFHVKIGSAEQDARQLRGGVQAAHGDIAWDLSVSGGVEPILLLPLNLYRTRFPAAKSLVGLPLAHYNGFISINDEKLEIDDWIGSQNHNWGRRHTDLYAWGQVAGFDAHPDSFLEVVTAKLRLGPMWTPPITSLVLRHQGQNYPLTGLLQSLRAHGAFDYFNWTFSSKSPEVVISGEIAAPRSAFVGLTYANPPGGTKFCLNTKIASCTVQVEDKLSGTVDTLVTRNRAAFEILTDDKAHGVLISI